MLRFAKDFYNRAKNWHLVSWIPYLPECIEVIDRCILERDYKLIHGVLRFDRHLAYRCSWNKRLSHWWTILKSLPSCVSSMIYLLTTISDIISHIVFITNRCKPRSLGYSCSNRPKMQSDTLNGPELNCYHAAYCAMIERQNLLLFWRLCADCYDHFYYGKFLLFRYGKYVWL